MESKEIDQLFKGVLGDAERDVRPDMWRRIENELDKAAPKKTRRLFAGSQRWMAYAAAISLFAVLSLVLWKERPAGDVGQAYSTGGRSFQAPSEQDGEIGNRRAAADAVDRTELAPVSVAATEAHPEKRHPEEPSPKRTAPPQTEIRLANIPQAAPLPGLTDSGANTVDGLAHFDTATSAIAATEIGPIRPLIVFEDAEESMYASSDRLVDKDGTVVINILNKLSENIDLRSKKEVRFKADEEGSIRIDFLAKNRNKKTR